MGQKTNCEGGMTSMFDTGKSALLSEDGKYRYTLDRVWGAGKPVVFVGLNPSTADAQVDDPTLRRMIGFAKRWGFPGVTVVNLFAVRLTYPAGLLDVEDPVGPNNDEVLADAAGKAGLVVVCWGNHGVFKNRCGEVARILPPAKCFGLTLLKQPAHPLYLPHTAQLEDWNPNEEKD